MYGTILPLSRNVVHTRVVLLGFEVVLTKICRHCLIRLQLKRHCCCCFVSQKLHLNIKTQRHDWNNHKWTVFFTIPEKHCYPSIYSLLNNNSSACFHEHITYHIILITWILYVNMVQIKLFLSAPCLMIAQYFNMSIAILHTVFVSLKWKRGFCDFFMITSRRIIVYEHKNWWIKIFFLVWWKILFYCGYSNNVSVFWC